jgi:hypothetical protein
VQIQAIVLDFVVEEFPMYLVRFSPVRKRKPKVSLGEERKFYFKQ